MKTVPKGEPLRKITVHVPSRLLRRAQKRTGEGITETIRQGLEKVARQEVYEEMLALRGKVKFSRSWRELKEDRR